MVVWLAAQDQLEKLSGSCAGPVVESSARGQLGAAKLCLHDDVFI